MTGNSFELYEGSNLTAIVTVIVHADKKIALAQTAEVHKGNNSHMQLTAPEIDKQGVLETDKLRFEGNLTSQEVNRLGTDKKTHVTELDVVTTFGNEWIKGPSRTLNEPFE